MNISEESIKNLGLFTEPELRAEIAMHCRLLQAEPGTVIVREGQYVKVVPIVLEGRLRVFQTREEREILLYYVEPTQTCMMSLSACFYNNSSPSQAVATETTEILAVPVEYVKQWQRQYDSWNTFVIRTFRNRYDELLDAFSGVAFDHIDKRVLRYLQQCASRNAGGAIDISHQHLANELGTTRVVVSRILKQLETDGLLQLGRSSIKLL